MTPVQMKPASRLTVATPLSDVAVAVVDAVAVTVVLALVSMLGGNAELKLVAVLAPSSAPVVAEVPVLEVSDVVRELEATVVVVAAVLFSMSTMDRTQFAASSVNFWK